MLVDINHEGVIACIMDGGSYREWEWEVQMSNPLTCSSGRLETVPVTALM